MIVVAGNVVNVVLELLFVYGFGWGIEGSAWGTVIAQAGMGAASRRHRSGRRVATPGRTRR